MKDYHRAYPLFSLCGLNCALCPMHLDGYCPGCGGGEGHQGCAIIRCSRQHGGVEFCAQCAQYPCERYLTPSEYDVFLPTGNKRRDLDRLGADGLAAYQAELERRAALLHEFLAHYNDGRRKRFYCVAANLLPLADLERAMEQLLAQQAEQRPIKERAALAAALLEGAAQRQGVTLKLRGKPKAKQ